MQQEVRLVAEITQEFRRKYFLRGAFFLLLGVVSLLACSMFLYLNFTYAYFLACFFVGLGSLWIGWSFFQKIAKMDFHPDEIIFYENALGYQRKDKLLFVLPFSAISSLTFISKRNHYGIGFFLKNTQKEKILLNDTNFDLLDFHKNSKKKYRCDLFFPFFSHGTYEELKELCTYLKQNLQFIHQGNLLSTEAFLENIMHSEDTYNF